MPISYAVLISLGICILAAILEGLFAGKNVRPFLEKLRTPAYAPPFWAWIAIGVCYYAICFIILYRILRHGDTSLKYPALLLLLVVMTVNAVWNYFFFRLENLLYSFILGLVYSVVAIAPFICLIRFDTIASLTLLPYMIYLIFGFYWGYGLLKLNPHLR